MKRVIYLSSATKPISDEEISLLLTVSRKRNLENNITGLLLYADGNFIQIIEGNELDVNLLFDKIQKDSRHKNVITVVNEKIKKRSFSDWSMGYSIVNPEFIALHPEINPFKPKKNNSLDKVVSIFIETFLNSFRNKILYN